jgi:hypothetical protein
MNDLCNTCSKREGNLDYDCGSALEFRSGDSDFEGYVAKCSNYQMSHAYRIH